MEISLQVHFYLPLSFQQQFIRQMTKCNYSLNDGHFKGFSFLLIANKINLYFHKLICVFLYVFGADVSIFPGWIPKVELLFQNMHIFSLGRHCLRAFPEALSPHSPTKCSMMCFFPIVSVSFSFICHIYCLSIELSFTGHPQSHQIKHRRPS